MPFKESYEVKLLLLDNVETGFDRAAQSGLPDPPQLNYSRYSDCWRSTSTFLYILFQRGLDKPSLVEPNNTKSAAWMLLRWC